MYEIANGQRIPNLAEKKFTGQTNEGIAKKRTAQVADVNKALPSVRKIVAVGNREVFDEESYIEDKHTGQKTLMHEDQGMYMLKMWVRTGAFLRPVEEAKIKEEAQATMMSRMSL